MIVFEIAKKLSALNLEVGFLASFNLPPHIKARMQELDWTETVLTLASFLGFIPEETAVQESAALHNVPSSSEDEVLDWVLACAPPQRLFELDMNKEKLRHWAHLSVGLHSLAKEYEPMGMVKNMDVFYAKPLLSVGVATKDIWLETQLKKWEGFVKEDVRYHDCVGNHWTMLDGENCWGLQKSLKDALAKRGVL
jgi:thioesterase domain-containing protein